MGDDQLITSVLEQLEQASTDTYPLVDSPPKGLGSVISDSDAISHIPRLENAGKQESPQESNSPQNLTRFFSSLPARKVADMALFAATAALSASSLGWSIMEAIDPSLSFGNVFP